MTTERRYIEIEGRVQGVGFRPFVVRAARSLGLSGYVRNGSRGVEIEAEGASEKIQALIDHLRDVSPQEAQLERLHSQILSPIGETGFHAAPTQVTAQLGLEVPLDVTTCRRCLADLLDPANRRYRYPFTTCAECGPRFTIAEKLPFDRDHTTMRAFGVCHACRAEYQDPDNRRFHAQTIACPDCGPSLALLGSDLTPAKVSGHAIIENAARMLHAGAIVAIKGIGGYQLLALASHVEAVKRLRERKSRPAKPFALLAQSIDRVLELCAASPAEIEALTSSAAPIVLLRRRSDHRAEKQKIAPAVAPHSPFLGWMLPCSPLHHLLLREVGELVVATSGNRHSEPICKDEDDLRRLIGTADAFVTHGRRIEHRADDSVVRVISDRTVVLRVGRGYTPTSVEVPCVTGVNGASLFALGGHEKNAFAFVAPASSSGRSRILLSQHIGDLDTTEALESLKSEAETVPSLLGRPGFKKSAGWVTDRHPDYATGALTKSEAMVPLKVQHHHAHVLACMAENGLRGPVLGIAWDGSGYGTDGTIWGGEVLLVNDHTFERVGHLRTFSLPGGVAAIRKPKRVAYALFREAFGDDLPDTVRDWLAEKFSKSEISGMEAALRADLNCPGTSSVGRLFDGVAAILGLCDVSLYSEQAPTALEGLAMGHDLSQPYQLPVERCGDRLWRMDWVPLVKAIHSDHIDSVDPRAIARGFHGALAYAVADQARRIGCQRVVLTGGAFQNAILSEMTRKRLKSDGFEVFSHARVPAGDGGLAVGQAYYGLLQSEQRGGDLCV